MQRTYRLGYALVAVLALAPAGFRMLAWRAPRPTPVDAALADVGRRLFHHEWTPGDPLCPGGDGLGPVFNATSCVACHHQGGVGGSGGPQHNVTLFTVQTARSGAQPREGVVHAHAVRYQETLAHVHPSLPPLAQPALTQLVVLTGHSSQCLPVPRDVHLSQRNTPALFGDKLIDEIPDRAILAGERAQRLKWGLAPSEVENAPVGRALRLADGRVGHFGWKAQTASLSDFVQAACANELGLGNPGQAQPRPLGRPDFVAPGLDLTTEQCNQLTAFVASLPRPLERPPEAVPGREQASAGKKLFHTVGCADCHTPDLGSVEGIYSDLLLHRMGQDLVGGGSYNEPAPVTPDFEPGEGPQPGEWRTPPLWGVADSAPYLHDGRAATLPDAIRMHGGQAARSAQRFVQLAPADKDRLLAFLKTLRAP